MTPAGLPADCEPDSGIHGFGEVQKLRAEIARLRLAIAAALDAPLPPGKHTTTGGVVFLPLAAALALQTALDAAPASPTS